MRVRSALAAVAILTVILGCGLARLDLADLGVPAAAPAGATPNAGDGVTVTWLGVTTLLFDDGDTRILTDGFFSRPGLVDLALDREVEPDLVGIEDALAGAGISSVAVVIPVHSHFDHAMDAGEVAKRTGAVVTGSRSTANVARGAGLTEAQIDVVPDGGSRDYGRFTVTYVRSRHAPIADGGPPFPGVIEEPLIPPAPVSAWKEDRSYSLVIAHPTGTIVVQGSAGYVEGALAGVDADVIFLGTGGLGRLGGEYTDRYWAEIVGVTTPTRVFPVHWDDFTRSYGDIAAFPEAFAGLEETVERFRTLGPDVTLESLPFGDPVRVLPPAP